MIKDSITPGNIITLCENARILAFIQTNFV